MVVSHLNDKDDDCTGGRDEVCDKKENTRTDALLNTKHKSLTHKAETAYGHHAETWQRDAVCLSSTNGLDSLWQIAQDETNAA
jgi:hypothetical protein